jgi:inner membrane protein
MEPVTHMLTGACLSRTGLNRSAAYATLTMVLAAEFPDVDMLWRLRGPVEELQHHRGITHAFLGLPFEAAFIVAGVYGWHQWRVRADARARVRARNRFPASVTEKEATATTAVVRVKPLTAAPVRWGVLYGLALLALLSHLLLDYTNNYGLRPFFPFSARWYAASILFIFDPLMFVMLLGALLAPWLLGLVGSEVGSKRQAFPARGWAIAALLGVFGWWTLREVEHGRAVQLALAQSIAAPARTVGGPAEAQSQNEAASTAQDVAPAEETPIYLSAQRALANPDPLSPFHWSEVTDFGPVYQLGEIDTQNGALTPGDTTYPKPGRSAAVLAAEGSKLGRVYMDWSPMPIVEAMNGDFADARSGDGYGGDQVVTFRDPRFMGGWIREAGRSPLSGAVTLDAAGKVVGERMGGRVER